MRVSQSTSSCSLRVVRFPPKIAAAPSTAPVVEKDQQEPHLPWFFTSDTAPRSTQSTDLRPTALRSPDSGTGGARTGGVVLSRKDLSGRWTDPGEPKRVGSLRSGEFCVRNRV